jgi:aldehyde dehydrogenase (NAD+)
METLRVGDPLEKSVDMGAIVAEVQLQKIARLVEQGRREGATCYQPSWSVPQTGFFFPPTLFMDAEPASTIAQVEIFGPVLVGSTFRTPAEAVELANNTPYGLAASVWTENVNLALDIAPKIKAGVVWVNCTNQFDAAAGFGGYRESGFGREGGREGLYEYVKPVWEKGLLLYSESELGAPTLPDDMETVSESPGLPAIDRTPQALHRQQAGPSRLGLQRPRAGRQGKACGRSRRGQPQGRSQRRRSGPQGVRLDESDRPRKGSGLVLPG